MEITYHWMRISGFRALWRSPQLGPTKAGAKPAEMTYRW